MPLSLARSRDITQAGWTKKLDNFDHDSPLPRHPERSPFELYFYISAGTKYRARQKLRGAIYARFSSRFQKSTADQLRECHEWAEKNNVDVSKAHIFIDEAISGRKRGRPGFQALLKAIDNDEIDIVLTFAINRIARKMYMALQFVEEYIVERQKRVVFVAQKIDTKDKHVWKTLISGNLMSIGTMTVTGGDSRRSTNGNDLAITGNGAIVLAGPNAAIDGGGFVANGLGHTIRGYFQFKCQRVEWTWRGIS